MKARIGIGHQKPKLYIEEDQNSSSNNEKIL
jgi:hypothetical protein